MSTPEIHAALGPSSADRWLNCPGSVLLTKDMPDTTSPYAEAGRLAHSIAEFKACNYFLNPLSKRSFNAALKKMQASEFYDKAMDAATDEYLEHLKNRAMSYPTAPTVTLETRVDFDDIVPNGFGTADCIMIGAEHIDVIDYKNGSGVAVDAKGNPQMMLYAYGALRYFRPIFGDSIQAVHLSIVQPHAGGVKEWDTTASEIEAWALRVVAPAAKEALQPDAHFEAGDWCRFCKARATCMERAKAMFDVEPLCGAAPSEAPMDNSAPSAGHKTLTDAEIGDILTRGKTVAAWLKDLEDYALKASIEGRTIAGWKVVEGRRSRDWAADAFSALEAGGIPEAMLYERKPVSVAALEKTMGKKSFAEAAAHLVVTHPGKPTLAPESDRRPIYDPAQSAFKEVD